MTVDFALGQHKKKEILTSLYLWKQNLSLKENINFEFSNSIIEKALTEAINRSSIIEFTELEILIISKIFILQTVSEGRPKNEQKKLAKLSENLMSKLSERLQNTLDVAPYSNTRRCCGSSCQACSTSLGLLTTLKNDGISHINSRLKITDKTEDTDGLLLFDFISILETNVPNFKW